MFRLERAFGLFVDSSAPTAGYLRFLFQCVWFYSLLSVFIRVNLRLSFFLSLRERIEVNMVANSIIAFS